MIVTAADRAGAVHRARRLNQFSISWNVAEAFVALGAGVAAGSVSLVAFGLDSVVEVSASVILAWRLTKERNIGCTQAADRRATRAISLSFAALALYVAIQAGRELLAREQPDESLIGIGLAAVSLVVMPLLAREKKKLAPLLGSRAQESEANQTRLCALLSAVLLIGLAANAALGWWWADRSQPWASQCSPSSKRSEDGAPNPWKTPVARSRTEVARLRGIPAE
jgi:divalent metal cation (Fe/Co/Zn/Cd) transporter